MGQFKKIDVAGVAEEINTYTVVDIRDVNSYNAGHIQGAINLNNDNVSQFLDKTPKDTPIVVVCYHGISSQQVAQFFIDQNYTDVYSMDGGFEAWKLSQPVSQI